MSLPVLKLPARRSAPDLLRLFSRTESLLSDALAEPAALPSGTALANPQLPNVAAANRIFDAAIPPGASPEQTIAEVHAHFAALGTRCHEWWLNPSQPPGPLAPALLASGYMTHPIEVIALPSPARPPDRSGETLSVFSARAALGHAAALAEEMAAGLPHATQQAEAFLLHLDDPHYELLLAMQAGQPLGMIGILAAGDLGRIDPLFVHPAHRGLDLERLLIERAIELSARSRFADVLAAPTDAMPAFLQAGFQHIGVVNVYKVIA